MNGSASITAKVDVSAGAAAGKDVGDSDGDCVTVSCWYGSDEHAWGLGNSDRVADSCVCMCMCLHAFAYVHMQRVWSCQGLNVMSHSCNDEVCKSQEYRGCVSVHVS